MKPRLRQGQLLARGMVHSQPAVSQLPKSSLQALKREMAAIQNRLQERDRAYTYNPSGCIKGAYC